MRDVLPDLDHVTPEWLTQVLQEQRHLADGRVTAVHLKKTWPTPVSLVAQLEVQYTDGASALLPSQLFLKTSRPDLIADFPLRGQKEVAFYTRMAAAMPTPLAVRCYDAVYAPEAKKFHLVLEDVSASHVQATAWPLPPVESQCVQAIDCLAQLHAHWWDHASLAQDMAAHLASAVQQGTFREDLYYRLRVMPVQVPPLREHREDIPLLAETFVQRHVAANKLGPRRFTPQALRALEQYDWPGNVRQLSHVIERAVTLSTSEWIDVEELGLEAVPQMAPHATSPGTARAPHVLDLPPDKHFNLDAVTRHLLVLALEKTRGHKGQAADLLGVHPRTLTRMMRRFALPED